MKAEFRIGGIKVSPTSIKVQSQIPFETQPQTQFTKNKMEIGY